MRQIGVRDTRAMDDLEALRKGEKSKEQLVRELKGMAGKGARPVEALAKVAERHLQGWDLAPAEPEVLDAQRTANEGWFTGVLRMVRVADDRISILV